VFWPARAAGRAGGGVTVGDEQENMNVRA
jgi:hypothetical protein